LKMILPALNTPGYRMVTVSQLVAGEDSPKPAASPAKPRLEPTVKPNLDSGSL